MGACALAASKARSCSGDLRRELDTPAVMRLHKLGDINRSYWRPNKRALIAHVAKRREILWWPRRARSRQRLPLTEQSPATIESGEQLTINST